MRAFLGATLAFAVACTSTGQRQPAAVPTEPIAPIASSDPPQRAAAGATVVDFTGIDAWLACRRDGESVEACNGRSAETKGGQIAELHRRGFGPPRSDNPAPPPHEQVGALVDSMRAWPDVVDEVVPYIPVPSGTNVAVYVIANGHGFGDAYVRAGPDGKPVALLNAVLIAAQYSGGSSEQAAGALGVLRHEVFHVLFDVYRQRAPSWSGWPGEPDPLHRLQLVVLNEGIGHFADARDSLLAEGFPADRAAAALRRLDEVVGALPGATLETPGVAEALREANQGRYWDKYGSIAGMLMAYAVRRAHGPEGIRESVRCGPGRFVRLYGTAVRKLGDLPALPPSVAGWEKTAELCP